MYDKFQNKYRIPSARLKNWDYGWNAAYFVTICTAHHKHYFGNFVVTQFIASQLGQLAQKYWDEIPQHFSFVKLDVFVVMPNHIHGIIIIDKNNDRCGCDSTDAINDNCRDAINDNRTDAMNDNCTDAMNDNCTAINRVSTNKIPGGITGENNPMINENLARILRWYKGRVTFESHKIYADFAWQTRFHDHIIRDEQSYRRIQQYIINNPTKWVNDKYNNPDKDN